MPRTVLGRAARALVAVAAVAVVLLPAVPGRALLVDGGSVAAGATGTGTEFSFAEGTTREGFQEYVTVLNPSTGEEKATLTWDIVDATTGSRSRRADHLTLPPGRTTVDVNRAVGAGADVSVGVDATAPVVVERPMYFAATLPGLRGDITGGSTVLGSKPATAFLFAEGTTRPGFQEYLTLLNPGSQSMAATIVYDIIDAVTGQPTRRTDPMTLAPGRTTIDVNATIGPDRDVSISVSAADPIVAERPTYFAGSYPTTGPFTGGTTAVGVTNPAAMAFFAEGSTRAGFQEYVTVLNPAPEVRGGHLVYDIVDAATGERRRTTTDAAFLPGRTTVDVNAAVGNERDVSVAVEADGPVAAERPVYFRATLPATGVVGGGSSVPGLPAPATTFLFAEGTTRSGFQEYLTLLNPGAGAVAATITWDTASATGERQRRATNLTLAPGRTTVDVNIAVGAEQDVSVRVETAEGVVAERPLYFRRDFPGAASIKAAVRDFLNDPRLAGTTAGISMVVAGYGEVAGQGADLQLLPASNQKLFTAAGALEGLGTTAHRATEVWATGSQVGDVLQGDLVLVGGGVPSLGTRGPGSVEALADQVKARGITKVTGALVGDETRYDKARTAPGWKTSYLDDGFIGPLSALGVDGNLGHEDDPGYLADPVPGNLEVFRTTLGERGITVDGPSVNGSATAGTVIGSVDSPTVAGAMTDLLTYSDNFTAELLVKELAKQAGRPGTTADGLTVVAAMLARAGLPSDGQSSDGSGLSRIDTHSANTIRTLLEAMRDRPWFPTLYQALPLAGRTGTLYARFLGTAAEGKLRGKTGSIDNVRALSGYVTTRGGRDVVFSILVNGNTGSVTNPAIDDFVARVADDGS